ncbi:MAG: tetratricopeptide repeat protein [candidate division Zixibacteria bacterium]|nr:tetratricopeptide repeat protein [candidate division Zixibacteria bacterium]
MKNTFCIVSTFVLLLLTFYSSSNSIEPPPYTSLSLEGIQATLNENYLFAEERFRQVISSDSQNPAGYFFLGALYQAEMMDYESDFREKEFYSTLETAIKLAQKKIRSVDESPWDYFYLGNSYGYLGVYKARKGSWWSALKNAMEAKSAFKKAVELDSTLYDAYLGLGSYHYWTSYFTKTFAWLPFFTDERERGIEELKTTVEKSIFSRVTALNALIWIYIKEKDYSKAIALADMLQKEYPDGKIFLWASAMACYETYNWEKAIEYYNLVIKKLERNTEEQYYNLIECKYHIAECYFNFGDFSECMQICKEALGYKLDEKTRERQENKLERIEELLEKSLKITGKK